MTVIDFTVIAGGICIAVLLYQHRSSLTVSDSSKNLFVIAIGALVIAGFYGVDLYTMWVLPHLVGMKDAMAAMEYLHRNVSWIAITLGFGAVTTGLAFSIRANEKMVDKLRSNEQELIENVVKLEKTERRYYDLMSDSRFGIRIERPGGERLFANSTCAKMFGFDSVPDYLAALDEPGTLVAPYDRERLLQNRLARQQGKDALNEYEYDALKKDGSILPVQVFVREIMWDDDPALLRTFIDISDRRAVEAELRESDARFRTFFDNSPSVMYVKDREHRLTYVNAKYLSFHGVKVEDVLGKRGGSTFDNEIRDKIEQLDQKVIEHNITVNDTVSMKSKSGETAQFYLTKFPVYGGNGEVVGVGGINTDVTELQEAREKAERAAEEAKAANASKSAFLANMSHEIRTPMNGVLGMANILSMTGPSPDQHDVIEAIKESGTALLDLLNDILDLSKIEANRIELEAIDFSLGDLFGSASALWTPRAQDKGIEFAIHNNLTDSDLIRSDKGRIRQVLNNLIGNAIKFTSEGHVEVHVEEVPRDDERVEIRFEVRDTGIGISSEQRSELFQPFSQADSSITRKYGGTGLGLTISKNLIELLGGEIGVESAPGEGSTFWFTIIAGRGNPATEEDEPSNPETTSRPRTEGGRTLRILIAEDNHINQKVVQGMLTPLNCQSEVVENGLEAVAAVMRSNYDLVLMDIHMPEMDGISATKQIRSLAGPVGQIPIIAITANAMQGDREKYLEAGMNDYVAKPIDQTELFRAITFCADVPMPDLNAPALAAPSSNEAENQPLDEEAAKNLGDLMGDLDDLLDGIGR